MEVLKKVYIFMKNFVLKKNGYIKTSLAEIQILPVFMKHKYKVEFDIGPF